MTKNQLLAATHKASNFPGFRFLNVADISCDINVRPPFGCASWFYSPVSSQGGLEFLDRATSLSAPFYDIPIPTQGNGSLSVPPLRMMAVDILPTAIPIDASKHFSKVLLPYLATLTEEDSCGENGFSLPEVVEDAEGGGGTVAFPSPSKRSAALRRATVARGGELMEAHKWLKELVDQHVGLIPDIKGDTMHSSLSVPTSASFLSAHEETPSKASQIRSAGEPSKSAPRLSGMTSIAAARQTKPLEGCSTKKKVLLLGSGMVAQPVVDYLVCKAGMEVTIGNFGSSVSLRDSTMFCYSKQQCS